MRLPVCILVALLVSAIATPVRETRDASKDEEVIKKIKLVKDPRTYESFSGLYESVKSLNTFMDGAESSERGSESRKKDVDNANLLGRAEEGAKVFHELFKATLVEGAKPTVEELTALAKRMSKVVRESRWSVRNDKGDYCTLMSNETIDLLKQIVQENPFKVSGNNHLDILKEKIPRLYVAANTLRKVYNGIKAALKTGDMTKIPRRTNYEQDEVLSFIIEFMADEVIALLKSEEAAIEIFKNFGIITDTLKTASSYESLQAFHNAMSRSKRLEAHGILIREFGKCLGKPLDLAEKAEWHQHVGKLLQIMKVLLADGEDPTKYPAMVDSFMENDKPALERLSMKIAMAAHEPQGKERLLKCLITEEDRSAFKDALAIPDQVFTDAQLSAIRQKNEKVYAFIHNLNGIVKVVRERQGLGAEADSFLKEMVTMPNSLLRIAEFFSPSQETLSKIASHTKTVVDKYNGLSGEAKKEFVNMFPYRTVINIATLE